MFFRYIDNTIPDFRKVFRGGKIQKNHYYRGCNDLDGL